MWTDDEACTVMDSFGIPLHLYDPPVLFDWLLDHFECFQSNGTALQAMDSQACGLYAMMFLVHKSVGGDLDTFLDLFSDHDVVKNDRWVAQWFQQVVERDATWHEGTPFRQANDMPVRLFEML